MKEAFSESPDIVSHRSGIQPGAHGHFRRLTTNPKPDHVQPVNDSNQANNDTSHAHHAHATDAGSISTLSAQLPPTTSSGQEEGQGFVLEANEKAGGITTRKHGDGNADDPDGPRQKQGKRGVVEEIRRTLWLVLTHSWMNVLLVFVPVGIIVSQIESINGGVVFAVNCIAIIPLAGLLSFATESVASKMGDALGALLNVTFGNAVELIIFIIALAKDQIRIVQASLLGSILANLLLILGMCFFFGGLRYREQVYNSTVTQMSACLLSLSVISLALPTAFHASFADSRRADSQSLKISRGTSVILLLVYIIYLLFQLKSHAYMYESTPQHIVDAESAPGPAAAWLDTSSSDSSSSDSSDSDDSGYSRDTVKRRMKKVLRAGRRRRSSVASTERNNLSRSGSFKTNTTPLEEMASEEASSSRPAIPRLFLDTHEEAVVDDEEQSHHHHHHHHYHLKRRSMRSFRKRQKKKRRHHDVEHDRHHQETMASVKQSAVGSLRVPSSKTPRTNEGEPRRLDFAIPSSHKMGVAGHNGGAGNEGGNSTGNGSGSGNTGNGNGQDSGATKKPFPTLRTMSVRNLAPTVFVQKPRADAPPPVPAGPVPRVRLGIRRTNSLPDRLPQYPFRAPGAMFPARLPRMAALDQTGGAADTDGHGNDSEAEHLSQWASVILLLVTTGLVAACAEFLVGSIEAVTSSSSLGEAFIGLILLPIVGNAAEHVTALTVAMKNKMDLAIGVAVGSSIQIAIFVTPLVVILGWIMGKDMTLYFTLFETVCLFVSAFIVNFLVLDGRSNYLEGALLCAVYSIIGVVAFFYPSEQDTSNWGS